MQAGGVGGGEREVSTLGHDAMTFKEQVHGGLREMFDQFPTEDEIEGAIG